MPASGHRRSPSRFKLRLVAGLLMVAVVVVCWPIWKLLADHMARIDAAKARSENMARAVDGHLEFQMQQVEAALKGLARGWQALPAGQRGSQDAVQQLLLVNGGQFSTDFRLAVFDAGGKAIASTSPLLLPDINYVEQEFFKNAIRPAEGLAASPPVVLAGGGRLLTLSKRIQDDAGTLLGLAVATIDIPRLQAYLDQVRPDDDIALTLVHGAGRVIARSPTVDQVFGRDMASSDLIRRHLPLAAFGMYESTSPFDQVPRIYSYRTVAGVPLVVVAGVPRRPVDQAFTMDLLVAGVGVSLILGLLAFGGRFVMRAYRRLERSEHRLVALTANAPNIIALLDPAGMIRYVNRGGSGFDPQRSMGTPIVDWLPQESRPRFKQALATVFDQGRQDEFEATGYDTKGAHAWYRTRMAPIFDGDQVVRAVLIFDDITARVAAEAEVLWLNDELERLVKERTAELKSAMGDLEAFSDSVTHDLRAPLCDIDDARRALANDYSSWLDETGRAHLERIAQGGRRMDQLIAAMIDLANTARQELHRSRLDLSVLVHEVAEELEKQWQRSGVTWQIADGVTAEGDADLLRQVCRELLDNALKFSCNNDSSHIQFGTLPELREGKTVYFVRDDGSGFAVPANGKLFRVFQRLHPDGLYPGLGVGLARAHAIIQRHGGKLWAEAAPEQGATFYFTL